MFALLPQSVRRNTLARLLRAFFIFVLIVSNLMLPAAVVAQAAPRAQAAVESPSAEPPPPVPLYSPSFAPLGEPDAIQFTVDDGRVTNEEADGAGIVNQMSEIVTLSLLSAAGAAEQPAGVTMELLPVEQASGLSPVGVAFTLDVYGADGALASSVDQPLQVNIDYAQLAQAYGGSFAERLTLYRVTPCAEGSEEACQRTCHQLGTHRLGLCWTVWVRRCL